MYPVFWSRRRHHRRRIPQTNACAPSSATSLFSRSNAARRENDMCKHMRKRFSSKIAKIAHNRLFFLFFALSALRATRTHCNPPKVCVCAFLYLLHCCTLYAKKTLFLGAIIFWPSTHTHPLFLLTSLQTVVKRPTKTDTNMNMEKSADMRSKFRAFVKAHCNNKIKHLRYGTHGKHSNQLNHC